MSEILPLPPGSTQQPLPVEGEPAFFSQMGTGEIVFVITIWVCGLIYMARRFSLMHWLQLITAILVAGGLIYVVGDHKGYRGAATLYGIGAAFLLTLAVARLGDWHRRRQDRH